MYVCRCVDICRFLIGYKQYSEANYFADQSGVFEIAPSKDPTHGNAMIQVGMNAKNALIAVVLHSFCTCMHVPMSPPPQAHTMFMKHHVTCVIL